MLTDGLMLYPLQVTEEEEEPVQRSSVPTLGSIYDAVVGFMTRYLNPPLVGVLAGWMVLGPAIDDMLSVPLACIVIANNADLNSLYLGIRQGIPFMLLTRSLLPCDVA